MKSLLKRLRENGAHIWLAVGCAQSLEGHSVVMHVCACEPVLLHASVQSPPRDSSNKALCLYPRPIQNDKQIKLRLSALDAHKGAISSVPCVTFLSCCCDKMPVKHNLRKEVLILAPSEHQISPVSVYPVLGLQVCVLPHMVYAVFGTEPRFTVPAS